MTVIVGAKSAQFTALFSDIYVLHGPETDPCAYLIQEKIFCLPHLGQTYVAIRGDEAFALIMADTAKCPGLDLVLEARDPFSAEYVDELATKATLYRETANAYCSSKGLHVVGAQRTAIYLANGERLAWWDLDAEDGQYRRRASITDVGQDRVRIDCGGSCRTIELREHEDPSRIRLLARTCSLPYEVKDGVTGVVLFRDPAQSPVVRRRADIPGDDLRVRLRS